MCNVLEEAASSLVECSFGDAVEFVLKDGL